MADQVTMQQMLTSSLISYIQWCYGLSSTLTLGFSNVTFLANGMLADLT